MTKNTFGNRPLLVLSVAIVFVSGGLQVGRYLRAQSSSRGYVPATQYGSDSRSAVRPAPMTFEQKFWQYLKKGTTAYDEWGTFPGVAPGLNPGKSPHGAFVQIFANKVARSSPKNLPHGSIIIKENYGADKKTLTAVTVMYRSKGYDPAHQDWYWVKYNPDGTVARTPADKGGRRIAGRFASCIDCHSGAGGRDFAYLNDKSQ